MKTSPRLSRAEKQALTRMRIVRCAQRLCLDRGFEGFTMDDLAESAEVSRRTLFNYFPSKVDAVLGGTGAPTLADPALTHAVEQFTAGGPHGVLTEDLAVLADHFLATQDVGRDLVRGRKEALLATPKLVGVVHERFEALAGEITDLILRRLPDLGPVEARLVVHLLTAVFDTAAEVYADLPESDPRTLPDLVREHVRTAAALLQR